MVRKKDREAKTSTTQNDLAEVHVRLFADSVAELKRRSEATGIPWQIELRTLVRRALAGERRDVVVIKE